VRLLNLGDTTRLRIAMGDATLGKTSDSLLRAYVCCEQALGYGCLYEYDQALLKARQAMVEDSELLFIP